jgi:hypothetical protein
VDSAAGQIGEQLRARGKSGEFARCYRSELTKLLQADELAAAVELTASRPQNEMDSNALWARHHIDAAAAARIVDTVMSMDDLCATWNQDPN